MIRNVYIFKYTFSLIIFDKISSDNDRIILNLNIYQKLNFHHQSKKFELHGWVQVGYTENHTL